MKVLLVQPKYPYGKSQYYLPGGLLNLGSRLLFAGCEVDLLDLNFVNESEFPDIMHNNDYDILCFSVLGAPYIPSVRTYIKHVLSQGYAGRIAVGGQGIARMAPVDFSCFFPFPNVFQYIEKKLPQRFGGGISSNIDEIFCLPKQIPREFDVSMVPMLKKLSTERLQLYLSKEFCLFLSQGCKYSCSFCQAAKGMKEVFSSKHKEEFEYICSVITQGEYKVVEIYVSNLDMLQTPDLMEERLRELYRISGRYGLVLRIRGLATARSACQAYTKDKALLERWKKYGVHTIAFGSDGATEEVWESQNKRHNTLDELRQAIRVVSNAEITVELLMVFGFQGSRFYDIWEALRFSFSYAMKGCHIRPYLAKTVTPGGNWNHAGEQEQVFLNNPDLLIRLDYAMLGSHQTHPSLSNRWLSNSAYLFLIAALSPLGLCPTRPLFPVPDSGWLKVCAETVNRIMPFDK